MDVRPEQTYIRNTHNYKYPWAHTPKYQAQSPKQLNRDMEFQFIDRFSAFWITIEGDKHPPPAAWSVSPTVTPRGRRRLLQKRFRVWRKTNDFTYSQLLLSADIFSLLHNALGCSPRCRCNRPYVLSAGLIVFTRLRRVGLTQNGGS